MLHIVCEIPVEEDETVISVFKSVMRVGNRHSNLIPCDGFEKLEIVLSCLLKHKKIPYAQIISDRDLLQLRCTECIAQDQY